MLSVCIPAYNEEGSIKNTVTAIQKALQENNIEHEFVIANDNSKDNTLEILNQMKSEGVPINIVNRTPPGGFGLAVRSCFENVSGEYVALVMADASDDPKDLITYYNKLAEGYDAVFGSRFLKESIVNDYPVMKLIFNRAGNILLQLLFWSKFNDLTNAFKAYRRDTLESILPLQSVNFDLTIEVSLKILRQKKYKIAQVPINWYNRKAGSPNFKLSKVVYGYLLTMIDIYKSKAKQ